MKSFALVLSSFILLSPAVEAAQPLFEPSDLQQTVKESQELREANRWTLQQQMDWIQEEMLNKYPERINKNPSWVFNQTGGALGQLKILHCSPKEYLIFFGSTIGTEGHSGRYDMEVWDVMLKGEMWTSIQGSLEKSVYRDGQMAYLPKHTAKAYKIPEYGYMLEYGRGNIIKSFQQGILSPAFFINQDFESMKKQLQDCAGLAIKGLFIKD